LQEDIGSNRTTCSTAWSEWTLQRLDFNLFFLIAYSNEGVCFLLFTWNILECFDLLLLFTAYCSLVTIIFLFVLVIIIYLVRISFYKSNYSRNICLLCFLIIADNGFPHRLCRFKDPKTNCYRCDVCYKFFTRRDHLRTHKKNLHGEDAGPFVCIVCSQLYKNVDSLRKHFSKFHITRTKLTDNKKLTWCWHYYWSWIVEFVWNLQCWSLRSLC
jgi:hypothetical protein